MTIMYSVDGPSNSGKTTVLQALAADHGVQVLPDAGDLARVFPPPPRSPESARSNERYCLEIERARSALLRTRWRTASECALDRSALSMLAIAYGYAHEYGSDGFADLCQNMSDLVKEGGIIMPDFYVFLRQPVSVMQERNKHRKDPLDSFWLTEQILARQLEFYDAWVSAMKPACVVLEGRSTDVSQLVEAVRAAANVARPPNRSAHNAILDLPRILFRSCCAT